MNMDVCPKCGGPTAVNVGPCGRCLAAPVSPVASTPTMTGGVGEVRRAFARGNDRHPMLALQLAASALVAHPEGAKLDAFCLVSADETSNGDLSMLFEGVCLDRPQHERYYSGRVVVTKDETFYSSWFWRATPVPRLRA